ncbi:uncharacterized protein N7479_002199 [Penicillium vulpinum]|uniref:Zn(2)-C6 fungal-type domain-containing protein n=1 Tax=Penicillium vulpinum TaxID=29845 RepID=A0A1V6S7J3_9EURO|nr:uncharacterized protein N7479_002199 [Penicillium vulpinum]KAJ5972281.1 hypothetical protein N7479_002199 [Penicillium vulpinum]OQE10035.1 hypothetical protein PENVUL_c005G06198 [Penicillium vulpinum]
MIAQTATRHQPSPFSPHPNSGRKRKHAPDTIYPSSPSLLASTMPYLSGFDLEQPMPQTWQLSSMTAMAHEARPIDPDILKTINELDNGPINNQPQELGVLGGPVCFDSLMVFPTIEDQPQSCASPTSSKCRPSPQELGSQPWETSLLGGPVSFDSLMAFPTIEDQPQNPTSPTSSKSRLSTWPSSANDSWSCTSTERKRARSARSSNETQPFAAPVRPLSPPIEEMYPDGFVLWDPANPGKSDNIREKIPRNESELLQQREDTAALKKAGGSCMACYRAKKKCGTTTPCPPCFSKGNRICFRSWGDLCLLGPPTGGSPTILGFPSQEAKDNLQRMSDEVFKHVNAFQAIVNIRGTYGGNCTAWHWTVSRSSITLSSKTECPVDDFLAGVTSITPLVDLLKFEDQHKSSPLVWGALRMANLFMAIQGLAQARIRTSWFEITTGRLVSFYILILSFRKLAEMSREFCPDLYLALCGKDKLNSNKKNRARKENEIDPAWLAAALYYRVVCSLQDLQSNPVVARIFGPSSCYLSGVREKLEDILRNVSPRVRATGKSSSRAILEDKVPKLATSPDIDMAFWLGVLDDPEQVSSSVLGRQDSPFSPPACQMQVFLADHFPRPCRVVNTVEQHDGHLQSSVTFNDTAIFQEHNAFHNVAYPDQVPIVDSNSLFEFLGKDYDDAFDPMAPTFDTMPLDTMPFNGNIRQSLYNC